MATWRYDYIICPEKLKTASSKYLGCLYFMQSEDPSNRPIYEEVEEQNLDRLWQNQNDYGIAATFYPYGGYSSLEESPDYDKAHDSSPNELKHDICYITLEVINRNFTLCIAPFNTIYEIALKFISISDSQSKMNKLNIIKSVASNNYKVPEEFKLITNDVLITYYYICLWELNWKFDKIYGKQDSPDIFWNWLTNLL